MNTENEFTEDELSYFESFPYVIVGNEVYDISDLFNDPEGSDKDN